jgi:hypothetical protein
MQILLYVKMATFAQRVNPSVFKKKKGDTSLNPTRDKNTHLFSLCVIYRKRCAIDRTLPLGPNQISTKRFIIIFQICVSVHLQTTILYKTRTICTINLKVFKMYLFVHCSTCFGHNCAHHQEPSITAHAVSGHRVVLGRMFIPALFDY